MTGTATAVTESESIGMSRRSWLRWKLDLEVHNGTPHPLAFGSDLLLIEANAESALFDGAHLSIGVDDDEQPSMAQAWASPARSAADYYGISNSERQSLNGGTFKVMGNTIQFTTPGDKPEAAPRDFGALPPKGARPFKLNLDQGQWVKEENRTSVRLVLPAFSAGSLVPQHRVIVYFDKTGQEGQVWNASRREVVALEAAELARLVSVPETNLVTRVLAANWLAAVAPDVLGSVILPLAEGQRQGQLLATCLLLARDFRIPGLESHAVALMGGSDVPNGIRHNAALYLGARKPESALQPLLAASKDKDDVVAKGALKALGLYGGEAVVVPLAAMLKDKGIASDRQAVAAKSLTETHLPSALAALQDAASGGSEAAIDALVEAPPPESFDFLAAQLRAGKHKQWEGRLLAGLRKANPERAFGVFMERLETAEPPDPRLPTLTNSLVDELIKLKPTQALPDLVRMARGGNLRALQVVAGSKDEAFRDPLLELAGQAKGPALRVALNGLVGHWPGTGVEVYRNVLSHPTEPEAIEPAARGLEKTSKEEVGAALVALGTDARAEIARAAAQALRRLSSETQVPDLLPAILATADKQVADSLAGCLIERKWADRAAAPRLGARLKEAPPPVRYPLVRLLRHLSQNAMGPQYEFEFDKDAKGWVTKWVAWAEEQEAAR